MEIVFYTTKLKVCQEGSKMAECGMCGKSGATFDAQIHSTEKEPMFCSYKCARIYYQ